MGHLGVGRVGSGVFYAFDISRVKFVGLLPRLVGSFQSRGLGVASRPVACPSARSSARLGFPPRGEEHLDSLLVTLRGADVFHELVRNVAYCSASAEGEDVVIQLDDWARVVGDSWRDETR